MRPISSPLLSRELTTISEAKKGVATEVCILPGDVLTVQGSGRLLNVGVQGGLLGHAMLALASPEAVIQNSVLGERLGDEWPKGVETLWKVPAIECSRGTSGLQRIEVLLYLDPQDRRLMLLGDVIKDDSDEDGIDIRLVDFETVDIWQSPRELRESFSVKLMERVLHEMHSFDGPWSFSTALRAIFTSATLSRSWSNGELLEHVKTCWETAPICTSVPIIFWQRYLCGTADAKGDSAGRLIRKWMPLSADRSLPGELVTAMRKSGWNRVDKPRFCR